MPELPPISEDFTANVTGYLAAIQSMIDRTQELVDKVEELQDLIDGLDGKIINIDVGGNALEQIGLIEDRLDALENRTVEVNVVYKALNEPGGVPVTSPVVGVPVAGGTGGAVAAEKALAAAAAAAEAALAKENVTASQAASIASKLGFAMDAVSRATHDTVSAETSLNEAAFATSSAFEELSARAQFLRGTIAQNEAYVKLLTDAYTAYALRVSPDIELTSMFAAKLAAAGGDAAAFRQAIAEGDPILLAFANGARAAGDNVGGILIPLTAASFGITGIATALHLVVMGTFEFLAVFIPAMYAAAAGAAVMMQGVQIVTHGVSSLYTAAEALGPMFNTTAGDMLGLGHSLQTAQNLANPAVYTLFGEALLGIRAATDMVTPGMSAFGQMGLTVSHILDQFGAKLVVDIRDNIAGIRQVLGNAVQDLVMFGQIFGNLGHALFNFATAMPGLAEVILRIIDGFSQLIKWVSQLPTGLLTAIIVVEEMYRWGNLLVGMFGMLGRAIALVGTLGLPIFGRIIMNIGAMAAAIVTGLAGAITNFTAMGAKIGLFGDRVGMAASTAVGGLSKFATFLESPWGAALLVGAIAVGVLVYAISRAKTATQEWIDTSAKMVQSASNLQVMNVIALQFVQAGGQIAMQQQALAGANATLTANVKGANGAMEQQASGMVLNSKAAFETAAATGVAATQQQGLGRVAGIVGTAIQQLTQYQQHLLVQNLNVASGAGVISKAYGVDFTTALGLADMAGVKLANGQVILGKNANQAGIQIEGLLLYYQKMNQTGTTLANSMSAVNVQAGLQASKVSGINQAWDQFTAMSTSLTGSFTQFNLDLEQMGNQATITGGRIQAFTGNSTLSIQQIAQSLTSFGGSSSQTWQSFNQSVSQANTFMDALRTASAAGTVTSKQYGDAAKYVVAQMIPYASSSKAALAEVMQIAQESGGPAFDGTKSLAQNLQILSNWTDQSKNSSKNFANELTDLTIGISNVTTVARYFAGTLQSDVLNAVAAAGADTTKITTLTDAYTTALRTYGTTAPQTTAAQTALTNALAAYGIKGQSVTQVEQILTNAYQNNAGTLTAGQTARVNLQNDIGKLMATVPTAQGDIVKLTTAVQQHGATANSYAGARQQLINDLIRAGVNAKTAAADVDGLITSLKNVPANVNAIVTVTGKGGETIVSSVGPGGSVNVYPVRAAAAGGVIPGYEPGHDSVLAYLSKGEGVLIPQAVRALGGEKGINAINKQAQHFAWGGVTGLPEQMQNTAATDFGAANAAVLAKSLSTINSQIAAKLAAALAAAMAGGNVSYSKVAGVTQWEGDVLRVLGMLGLPAADLPTVMAQILTESGGNPNAINRTDINAQRGDPSRGLLQTIGSTFAAYRSTALSSNIYDPLANIYAGLNYAIHAYGNPGWLSVLGHGHGYDNGGWLMPGLTMAYNGTGQPERVSPPGGDGTTVVHQTVLDGKVIAETVNRLNYQRGSRNNGNANSGKYWAPGNR